MFKIGDRVIVDNVDVHGGNKFIGRHGVVISIAETWIAPVTVQLDTPRRDPALERPDIANFAESELRETWGNIVSRC